MKKVNSFLFALIIVFLTVSACKKQETLDSFILDLGGDSWEKTELDNWIYTNFTVPYNMSVLYKWDANEMSISKTLTPTREEKVIPVMEVIRDGWINVYKDIAGEEFVKKYAPRQFVLVGSPSYNTNGSITIGTATAGTKIIIYRTNWYDAENRTTIKQILNTMHHEFAHILHQNVIYPEEFERITPGGYTSAWTETSTVNAREMGFISSYARSHPNEDFVEIVAYMLTEGKEGYDEIINSISSSEAKSLLRQKEEIVAAYFAGVWDIDIYALQKRTEQAISQISPIRIENYFSQEGKSILRMNYPGADAETATQFATAYQDAAAVLGARTNTEYVNWVEFRYHATTPDTHMMIRAGFGGNPSTSQQYIATMTFEYTQEGNKLLLSNPEFNGNWRNRRTAWEYFFRLIYPEVPEGLSYPDVTAMHNALSATTLHPDRELPPPVELKVDWVGREGGSQAGLYRAGDTQPIWYGVIQ